MRHVIPKNEVAAAWVAQDRDHARTPTNNFWFNSFSALHSYSTVVASRVKTPPSTMISKDIIFVTENKYSVTTSAQLRLLNDILNRTSKPVIYVPYIVPTHTAHLPGVWKDLTSDVKALWNKAQRARSNKPYLLAEGNHYLKTANKLVDIFGEDVTKGIAVESIEEMQEEMRINEAQMLLRA